MGHRLTLLFALSAFTLQGATNPCPVTINASDMGWYSPSGYHNPANDNYLAGFAAGPENEYRDWFVFNLPATTQILTNAELRIFTWTVNDDGPPLTFELRHVATPVSALVSGGIGLGTNVFNDLGDGAVYGTRFIFGAEDHTFITIPLNSNALPFIAAASGTNFAMGGRVTTVNSPSGEYVFGSSGGTSSSWVQLILNYAPTNTPFIASQPLPLYSTTTGQSLDLTVSACGAAPLFYQWLFNGAPLMTQTNPVLHFASLHTNDIGNYFAVATNPFGAATSSVTRLAVDYLPAYISAYPQSLAIAVGHDADFYAAGAGIPSPSQQWRFNGLNIPGATNNNFTVFSVQPSNGGTYTFIVSNTYGMQSADVILSIEPLLILPPVHYGFEIGSDVYMEAAVDSVAPVSYQWRFHGTNIFGATGRFLSRFDATTNDTGLYEIVASNSYGSRTGLVAFLDVGPYPPRIDQYYPPGFGRVGSDVVFSVDVSGSKPLGLQWYFNAAPIPGATNSQLLLQNLTTNNFGVYWIIASNALGFATSSAPVLSILNAAPISGNQTNTVFAGDAMRLGIRNGGAPIPRLQWNFNQSDLPGETNVFLLLTDLATWQSGEYSNTAANAYGTNAFHAHLDVRPRRALDRWTWRNPRPQGNDLEHIAFGNGRYVAGGEGGSLVVSSNTVDWTTVTLGNKYTINRVAFGNGLFGALVRHEHASMLFTSPDGLSWTPHQIPSIDNASSLDFVNGQFTVCGVGSQSDTPGMARSPDGITWQASTIAGPSEEPDSVAYGNGVYVAVSYYEVFSSATGIYWKRSLINVPNGLGFTRVRFVNGRFIALAALGQLWSSLDGVHWFNSDTGTASELDSVAYGNGRYVAVGDDGALVTSTDGATWTLANSTTSKNLKDVIFDGAQFVVTGNAGALLTSSDGLTWTDRRGGKTKDLYGIIYTNGLFVAVGYSGTILTSPDGVTWTSRTSGTSKDLHAITYGAGQFVAVGRNGTVLTSPNATAWTSRSTPTTNYLERITYGNGLFVVVGSSRTILTSSNAIDWILQYVEKPVDTEFEGVAFGGGTFVAVGGYFSQGAHSLILTSTNGINWAQNFTIGNLGVSLRGVVFAINYFLLVGNDGRTVLATNVATNALSLAYWQEVTPFENLRHATFGAGRFVVVGNEGTIASQRPFQLGEPVQHEWTVHRSIVSQNLHDVAYGEGKFVAVGNAGTIVQSDSAQPAFHEPAAHGHGFYFSISGGIEDSYRIQSSTNLVNWNDDATYDNDGFSHSYGRLADPQHPPTNNTSAFLRVIFP